MTERPILFSGPMVRAILEGRKTQTRRIVKPQPTTEPMPREEWDCGPQRNPCPPNLFPFRRGTHDGANYALRCPYGIPGDRLWIKETWRTGASIDGLSPNTIRKKALDAGYHAPWMPTQYLADGHEVDRQALPDFGDQWGKTRVSIHMPRWASRLTLRVADVRVERLQVITDMDAHAEGVPLFGERYPRISLDQTFHLADGDHFTAKERPYSAAFATIWDEINSHRAPWSSNPWVWVVAFEVVQ